MDVREKLVELLNKANSACVGTDCFEGCKLYMENDCLYKLMADVMIAHGVTVQECKVGDTIYEVDSEHGVIKHDIYEVCVVFKTTAIDDKGNEWDDYWTTDDIGNAYKTRREAEAALPQPPKGE